MQSVGRLTRALNLLIAHQDLLDSLVVLLQKYQDHMDRL
nr:MAG TPA: hypothetical protein [Caudoviricetes sp.]